MLLKHFPNRRHLLLDGLVLNLIMRHAVLRPRTNGAHNCLTIAVHDVGLTVEDVIEVCVRVFLDLLQGIRHLFLKQFHASYVHLVDPQSWFLLVLLLLLLEFRFMSQ